jgi:hypothetical protein
MPRDGSVFLRTSYYPTEAVYQLKKGGVFKGFKAARFVMIYGPATHCCNNSNPKAKLSEEDLEVISQHSSQGASQVQNAVAGRLIENFMNPRNTEAVNPEALMTVNTVGICCVAFISALHMHASTAHVNT